MHDRKMPVLICGVDEVGRGPLAGPVTAAATILPTTFDVSILRDSKALSPSRREKIEALLRAAGVPVGLGWVDHHEIDALNIHNAALLAMERAVTALAAQIEPQAAETMDIVVDGRFCPPGLARCTAIIGADASVPEVMAASIFAKNARDAFMVEYAERDGRYGFERHKGYPTKAHTEALRRYGPCPIHRRSFRGVVDG